MAAGFEFELETPDLASLLARLKEFEPALARDFRRELRRTGDDIIRDQQEILMGPLPGPIRKSGEELRLVVPRNGRKPYFASRNTYETGDPRPGGVDQLRAKIRKGLTTRVTATRKTSIVTVKTTGPKNDGYNMARIYQAAVFRHPVFSGDVWTYQQGMPYFWKPAYKGRKAMQEKVLELLHTAVARFAK